MASYGDTTDTGSIVWFPNGKNNNNFGWRFDVITLLAIIGESSIAEHAQTLSATPLCLLPRLIPAPQALLKSSRPTRLPFTAAKMVGVYSGVVLDSVGFFANIMHPLDDLPAFSFKVLEIKHRDLNEVGDVRVPESPKESMGHRLSQAAINRVRRGSVAGSRRGGSNMSLPVSPGIPRGPPLEDSDHGPPLSPADGIGAAAGINTQHPHLNSNNNPKTVTFRDLDGNSAPGKDLEANKRLGRQRTFNEKTADFLSNPTLATTTDLPAVPAKTFSPIHLISVVGFILSLVGIGISAIWQDGLAMVSIASISLASSVVGYASWWRPILMKRSHTNTVPNGDVVIRTREGAFLLIKCTEEVARELYSGTEECEYRVNPTVYRGLMGVGTIVLMISVILLSNCGWYMQVYIGGAYVLLNALYWALGMLPKTLFWDLGRYDVKELTPEDSLGAEGTTDEKDEREGKRSFTRTLWYAIRETKITGWCIKSGAAPDTEQWRKWLAEAEEEALKGNRKWGAVQRKNELMKEGIAAKAISGEVRATRGLGMTYDYDGDEVPDGAQAPASTIQPSASSEGRR